jgi:FkbM family methyltransferase
MPVPWHVELDNGKRLECKILVDSESTDPIMRALLAGTWQLPPAVTRILTTVRPGDSFLDVGAHIGTVAVLAAVAGARVVALEPSPVAAPLLRANVEANGVSMTVVQSAVDAVAGRGSLVDCGPFSTLATASIGPNTGYPTVEVDTVTLDEVPGAPFDWAKFDIEGGEIRALRGATRTLGTLRALAIESNGYMLRAHGSSPAELTRTVQAAGFSVFEAYPDALRRLRRPLFQPETTVDYLGWRTGLTLPDQWTLLPRRRGRELWRSFALERRHPINEHRSYASSLKWKALPLVLSRRLW